MTMPAYRFHRAVSAWASRIRGSVLPLLLLFVEMYIVLAVCSYHVVTRDSGKAFLSYCSLFQASFLRRAVF